MTRILGCFSIALACALLCHPGCQYAKFKGTNHGIEVLIMGDDGYLITAVGLEDALMQSIDHLHDLQKKGAPESYIDDWEQIIECIVKKKDEIVKNDPTGKEEENAASSGSTGISP